MPYTVARHGRGERRREAEDGKGAQRACVYTEYYVQGREI